MRCYLRIFDWADSETITLQDGLRQLRSSRTQFNLGNYYLKRNMYHEAELASAAFRVRFSSFAQG